MEMPTIAARPAPLESDHVTFDGVLQREGRQERDPTDQGNDRREGLPESLGRQIVQYIGRNHQVEWTVEVELAELFQRAKMQVAAATPTLHRPFAAVESNVAHLGPQRSQVRVPTALARTGVQNGTQGAGEEALRDGDREGDLAAQFAARDYRVSPITVPSIKIGAIVLLGSRHCVMT